MARKMKDSGVEWIGEIPEDWEIDRVKYHFKIISGSGFPIERQGKENGDYPVCKASDIADANKSGVLYSAANFLDKKDILGYNIVPKDSIIMPKIGEAMKKNNRAITGCDVLVDNNCQGLFSTSMDVKYAYYLFRIIDMNWFDNAGTIPCVNNIRLINSSILYPSYKEQKNISNKIDKKVKVLENIESKITIQLQALEDYKKSVITEAVTKGLDKNVEMKDSGIEWIGEIPKHWKLVKGKYIFKQRNSRGNDIDLVLLSPSQKYGVIPQDLYEELSGMRAVKLDLNTNLNNLKTIHVGDFCISLRSFQGGFEYSNYEGVVSPAYQVFYSYIESCNDYYKYMFKERGFIEKMNSFTMSLRDGKNISFRDFANSYIPKPPIGEQQEIAKQLNKFVALTNNAIAAKQKQLQILEEYKKSLIYEYVTGKKEVEDVGTI